MKLSSHFIRKAEYYLYNCIEIQEDIKQTKKDIAALQSYDTTKNRTGQSNKIHDITGDKVVRLIQETQEHEEWLKIVQATFSYYNHTDKGRLIYSKYVLKEPVDETLRRLGMSRTNYFKSRREILTYMAVQVAYNNLMSIDRLIV